MVREANRLPGVSAHGVSGNGMYGNRISMPGVRRLIVGVALLAAPLGLLAQRGGGTMSATGTPYSRRPIICLHDCRSIPDRISSEDDLKTFQHLMAVQATDQQSAAFLSVVQDAQAASAQLKDFRELLQKAPTSSARSGQVGSLDQAIAKARTGNQGFLASFSSAQESGLKDLAKKLEEADLGLDKEIKALDAIVQSGKPDNEPIANSAASLDKALASFQSGQIALASEMSIILPSAGQELTFNLPPVSNSVNIAGQAVSIPASGIASRTSAADGRNLFSLKLVADLSDLQQNITEVLRSQLTRSPRCGERVEIQEATLIPQAPSSLVVVHLHFERWICPPGPGPQSPTELAEGEGTMEVKLTPSVEQNAGLRLASDIDRVEADGFLREALLSGALGTSLREQVTALLVSAMQRGTDLTATLPPAAHEAATIHKARFEDARAGQLSLIMDGQLQLSDEQTQQFATQLKQRLSAQQTPPR